MARFEDALPYVLAHEGGWSNDPDDPGGATMQGITLATAQRHGILTKEALHAITPDQVAAIYRQDYWRFNGLVNQRVATKILDMGVNMGVRTAIRLVQEGLNDLGASLTEDGLWGPVTEACVNAVAADTMLDLLKLLSEEHYRDLVKRRPRSAKFLAGWLKRAAEVPCA